MTEDELVGHLRDALMTSGFIDPDDGTVPMWPHGDQFPRGPVWVDARKLCRVIVANFPADP